MSSSPPSSSMNLSDEQKVTDLPEDGKPDDKDWKEDASVDKNGDQHQRHCLHGEHNGGFGLVLPARSLRDQDNLLQNEPCNVNQDFIQGKKRNVDVKYAVERFAAKKKDGRQETQKVVSVDVDVVRPGVVDETVSDGFQFDGRGGLVSYRTGGEVVEEVFGFGEFAIAGGLPRRNTDTVIEEMRIIITSSFQMNSK